MQARIIRIGNSRGIRLPKSVLEECRLGATVDLSVEDGLLVVRPVPAPRAGWEEAFRTMAELGDDTLLDAEAPLGADWDEQEWEWPAL
ncbi:MAG: AbrB/MazE/SpoVT family DNA-binding domain-containing protein [Chloroflexota bacterium]